MATIARLRSLKNGGILSEWNVANAPSQFRRYNLVYGFNGSGKSTLSRIFASLRSGSRDTHLPENCSFEIELSDGNIVSCPDQLSGLENRLLVFNADFIEQNLQWNERRANPIFYIGQEQAQLAAQIAEIDSKISTIDQKSRSAQEAANGAERNLILFKRERARLIADILRERARRYEAPQFVADMTSLDLSESAILGEIQLAAAVANCNQVAPLARLPNFDFVDLKPDVIEKIKNLIQSTPAVILLDELQKHSEMLLWVRDGYNYHLNHRVSECLFCSNIISSDRLNKLGMALDGKFGEFLAELNKAEVDLIGIERWISSALQTLPPTVGFYEDLRSTASVANSEIARLLNVIYLIIKDTIEAVGLKKTDPTKKIDISQVNIELFSEGIFRLNLEVKALNTIIDTQNKRVDDFHNFQREARLSIRRHYVRDAKPEFDRLTEALVDLQLKENETSNELMELRNNARTLRAQIRQHGPAAEKINKLVESYLGHNELTVSAVEEGYEIHRHGKIVEGSPSEGEKTAIALCYFISMLDSDGRKIKDQIIVVDDPISSLDTRAMNFACSILRNRLKGACQVILLTHNQHCMSEFSKIWKNLAKKEPAEAALFFMDVTIPKGKSERSSRLVVLPKFLREYDFEYHFLFHHILLFEANSSDEYEYAYMIPNVLRRVLDVFLAFRCPGNSGLAGKIEQLCREYTTLNQDRMASLERLVQIESHSDSLDDLIKLSSMTLEETRDATSSLLEMMQIVDAPHLAALRKLCRPGAA